MKIMKGTILGIALLAMGFALGFPVGKNVGFNTGSEWAIMQANIIAKEAGMFMPIDLENGAFRLKFRQPSGFHERVWKFTDEREMENSAIDFD